MGELVAASECDFFVDDIRLPDGVHPRHQLASVAAFGLGPGAGVRAGHPVDAVTVAVPLDDSCDLRSVSVFGAVDGYDVERADRLAHVGQQQVGRVSSALPALRRLKERHVDEMYS